MESCFGKQAKVCWAPGRSQAGSSHFQNESRAAREQGHTRAGPHGFLRRVGLSCTGNRILFLGTDEHGCLLRGWTFCLYQCEVNKGTAHSHVISTLSTKRDPRRGKRALSWVLPKDSAECLFHSVLFTVSVSQNVSGDNQEIGCSRGRCQDTGHAFELGHVCRCLHICDFENSKAYLFFFF